MFEIYIPISLEIDILSIFYPSSRGRFLFFFVFFSSPHKQIIRSIGEKIKFLKNIIRSFVGSRNNVISNKLNNRSLFFPQLPSVLVFVSSPIRDQTTRRRCWKINRRSRMNIIQNIFAYNKMHMYLATYFCCIFVYLAEEKKHSHINKLAKMFFHGMPFSHTYAEMRKSLLCRRTPSAIFFDRILRFCS